MPQSQPVPAIARPGAMGDDPWACRTFPGRKGPANRKNPACVRGMTSAALAHGGDIASPGGRFGVLPGFFVARTRFNPSGMPGDQGAFQLADEGVREEGG